MDTDAIFNQSCHDGSGTWSWLICLSLQLVCLQCDMSVKGLGLVVLPSRLCVHKTSLTLHLVCILNTSCREVYHLVGGFLTDSACSCLFSTFLRLSQPTQE